MLWLLVPVSGHGSVIMIFPYKLIQTTEREIPAKCSIILFNPLKPQAKFVADNNLFFFFFFSQKISLDMSCESSPWADD